MGETTVPCCSCGLPTEEDSDMRCGPLCESCMDDTSALGFALLLCRSADDAKGHWFYWQEWKQSTERKDATHGLVNCDQCGFLMRLPFPIGGPRLCVHCNNGKKHPTEEGAAFIRIPQPIYLSLDALRNKVGMDWTGVFKLLDNVLRGASSNETLLAKIRKTGTA